MLVGVGALSISYDLQNGLLNSTSVGNVSGSYGYNTLGELTSASFSYNASALFDRSYGLDSLGRITSVTETIGGETETYEYTYNDIGYLVMVNKNGLITDQYQYDPNGNRTVHITPADTITAAYDDQDRLLTYGDASYVYGKRGDLRQKIVGTDTTRYDYDNIGNLRSVLLPDGRLIEYVIDGQDRRVAKKVNGSVVKKWLYHDQLNPVAELNASDSVTARFVYGTRANTPDYIIKNDTTYSIITDQLGSVRLVVNTQTGAIVQRIDYDAYGAITYRQNPDEFTDIGFAGGLYDKDTGLIRFGARDYDPKIGRWTSKDPILFAGGTSNLYEYALNDPVNYYDPDGLQALKKAYQFYYRHKGAFNAVRDFAASYSTFATGTLADYLFNSIGSAGARDKCSDAYAAGMIPGIAANLALDYLAGKALWSGLFKNTVSRTKDVLGHIFRNARGHVNPSTVTSQNRYIKLFEDVASNPFNRNSGILDSNAINAGVQGFTQTFRNGKQVWVHVRNGKITNAGVNNIPR